MRLTLLSILVTAIAIGGCKDLTLPAGLPCGPGATCPQGQVCSPDGFCLPEEDLDEVDGSVSAADAAPPDAEEPPPPSMYITIDSTGGERTDYEILLSVNTERLIGAELLDPSCDEMHFADSEAGDLPYWVETGCNTQFTQVWVRFATLPAGETTLHWTYSTGEAGAPEKESWNGTVIAPRMGACQGDSVAFTPLDAVFPRGSETYTGEPNDGAHSHAINGFTAYSTAGICDSTGGGLKYGGAHNHSVSGNNSQSSVVQVSSVEVVYCAHSSVGSLDWLPDDKDVVLLDLATPEWEHVDAFTDRFPKGAVVFGLTAEAAAHSHVISGTTGGPGGVNWGSNYTGGGTCEASTGAPGHTHGFSLGSAGATPTPPYLDLLFATRSDVGPLPPGAILITQSAASLPPMGWSRYAALDGRFPRGASSPGGTGGEATHTHSFSGTSGTASAGNCYNSGSGGAPCDPHNHTHSLSGTTLEGSSNPPHLDVVFMRRAVDDTTKSFAPGP